MTVLNRLIFLISSCLLLYLGGILLAKETNNKKILRINLWIYLILYVILFLTLTLFDAKFGRSGLVLNNYFSKNFINYVKITSNIIPFKTIIGYLKSFNSLYSTSNIMFNLLGNLFALVPLGLLLCLLFKKQNKFKNYLITILLLVFGVEIAQLLTSSGAFDIDDIILNTLGAIIWFFIYKIKSINYLIRNIFLLEKNPLSKKSVVIIVISVGLIILFILKIIDYRNKLYKKNYEKYIENTHFSIVDETKFCINTLDKFYEDKFYKYYFVCQKENNIYIKIDNKKYLIEEILNNTSYGIDINQILNELDKAKIKYYKQNKYEIISCKVPYQDDNYILPNYSVNMDKIDIVSIESDYYSMKLEDNLYQFDLHVIPIKKGRVNIKIKVMEPNDEKVLKSYEYSILVDDKLKVTID